MQGGFRLVPSRYLRFEILPCPRCGGRKAGKIGPDTFFCWQCFVEYNTKHEVFTLTPEGGLLTYTGEETNLD